MMLTGAPAVSAQGVDYARAEQMLTWNTLRLMYHDQARPNWIRGGERGVRFWYRVDVPGGAEFNVVDPVTGSRAPLFDPARLATAMSVAADTSYTSATLPVRNLEIGDEGRDLRTVIFVAGARR